MILQFVLEFDAFELERFNLRVVGLFGFGDGFRNSKLLGGLGIFEPRFQVGELCLLGKFKRGEFFAFFRFKVGEFRALVGFEFRKFGFCARSKVGDFGFFFRF